MEVRFSPCLFQIASGASVISCTAVLIVLCRAANRFKTGRTFMNATAENTPYGVISAFVTRSASTSAKASLA